MEIRVLGPVEVVGPQGTISLRGRLAAVLAVLVAKRPHPVAVDTLVEYVFDGDPPPGAVSTVYGYVHRLRRRAPGVIESLPSGYRLGASFVVDADLFEVERRAALAAGRAGDRDGCRDQLESALGRWRGFAYGCFADRDYAEPEAVRLEELRCETEDDYFELRSATEDTEALIAQLEAAVRVEPSRERRWALLIAALQRGGRPADAAATAARFRDWLIEEFQVTPSAEFEALTASLFATTTKPDAPNSSDANLIAASGAHAALDAVPVIPIGVAVEVAFDAGRRLTAEGALEVADDLYGHAIALIGDSDPRRAIRAHLGRAEVRALAFAPDWIKSLDDAVELAHCYGYDDLLVQAALLNPHAIATGSSRRVELIAALLTELPADSPDRPALLAQHAIELFERDDSAVQRVEMHEALDKARAVGDDNVRIEVLAAALNDTNRYMRPDVRGALAAELDELAGRVGEGRASWLAAAHRYWCAVQNGQGAEARDLLRTIEVRAAASSDIDQGAFTHHLLAIEAFLDGRLDDADLQLRQALPRGPLDDSALGLDRYNRDGVLLRLRREQGRLAELLPLVTGEMALLAAVAAPSARALIAAELGDRDAARAALAACRAEQFAPPLYLPHFRSVRLEAAALIGDVERAQLEADRLRPYAGQVLCGTRGCDGAVDRYLGLAAAAVGDRAGCDRWLRSALVIHERLGSPTYLARTLYDRARLLADAPARDHALLVARRHHLVALTAALASEVFARGARPAT